MGILSYYPRIIKKFQLLCGGVIAKKLDVQ